jgi:molybdopterin converting factor small subunit
MMARVRVMLPPGISYPDRLPDVVVEAVTVREALERVVAGETRLAGRVFTADGGFATAAFVNGVSAKRLGGMDTPLADGDVVTLMAPIAGG